jgi:hypothetical protein
MNSVSAPNAGAIQGFAYAVAYPFGINLTVLDIHKVFGVDVGKKVAAAEETHRPT